MVTRKPVNPPAISTSNFPSSNNAPPYPATPKQESAKTTASSNSNSVYSADLKNSPAFDLIDVQEARERARSDSDASSHGTWDSDDTEHEGDAAEDYVEVPKPLQIKGAQTMNGEVNGEGKKEELPAILRIGPTNGVKPAKPSPGHGYEDEAQANPWAAEQLERRQSNTKNPYLKESGFSGESSQSAWQDVKSPPPPMAAPPPPPSEAPPAPPVELPTVKSPTGELKQLSIEHNGAHDSTASWETVEKLSVPQRGQSPFPPVTEQNQEQQSRPVSTWWQDSEPEQQDESAFAAPPDPPPKQLSQEKHDELYEAPPGPPPGWAGTLIDHEAMPTKSQRRVPVPITTSQPSTSQRSDAIPETPATKLKREKNEHYQIKHINWFDASATVDPRARSGMRNSPILMQNANGPCPLLALVNALVLSTPHDLDTALVETLRTREQVSLGLLLDAVFDELMSGRRGDTAHQLPDVSELYSFLLALHTGMNVNPRFVTPATTPRGSWDGIPPEMSGMHPAHKAQYKAGAFEETREMRLYSTFNIPLIHGWTAPTNTPAYEAFMRSAQTFEDAQNVQFAEAELEDKSRSQELTPQEQQTLQVIHTIKTFLSTWPTQLTDHGLETMSKSLRAGQIAILFRNDHFGTVYKEPKHGALMTLVTDAGYSSHDEIVWESLVDVNGAASEMFSGDLRVVSHGQNVRLNEGNSGGGEEGWQTVPSRNRNQGQQNSQGVANVMNGVAEDMPPPLPGPRPQQGATQQNETLTVPDETALQRTTSEQEDHDLALALQLQEEEEEHHRQAELQRQRELELSEQFISNEAEGPRPPIPPRRGGGRSEGSGPNTAAAVANTNVPVTHSPAPAARPPVNRPSDSEDPDAPPSYEQAASDRPYRPAGSTAAASISQGNPLSAYDALRRQQSAYAQQSSSTVDSITGGPAAPPYTPSAGQPRRRSEANRIQRRSSQLVSPVGPSAGLAHGHVAPGHTPTSMQASYQRTPGIVAPGHTPTSAQASYQRSPGIVAPGYSPTSAQASFQRTSSATALGQTATNAQASYRRNTGVVAPGHTPTNTQARYGQTNSSTVPRYTPANDQASGQRVNQAASVKDADDSCVVM